MKNLYFYLLVLCVIGMSCNKLLSPVEDDSEDENNIGCIACGQKEITKIVENELATIVYSEYPIQTEGVDSLAFVTEQNNQEILHPCYGQVPLKYREAGLKVRISGNVTNCIVVRYAPNVRLLPAYILELTSIEKVEQ